MTSGSTGEPKLIPVTASTKRNHRELTRLWYYRAYLDHPGFLSNKLLGLVSPADEGRTPGGLSFGDVDTGAATRAYGRLLRS
jgi:hypothetical protein